MRRSPSGSASPDLVNEMRDEGLLKLFFAGAARAARTRSPSSRPRAKYAEKHRAPAEIEPLAERAERFGPLAVLRYGLGMSEFAIAGATRT